MTTIKSRNVSTFKKGPRIANTTTWSHLINLKSDNVVTFI